MDNIVLEIYRRDFSSLESIHNVGPKRRKTMLKILDSQERFEAGLTEEQKKNFEDYKRAINNIADMDSEHDFLAGYRLGMRLAFAVLQEAY